MNNRLKSFGILILLCFSFYYTHQFALLMRKKDPIYQTILMSQEEQQLASVNAIIDGEYMVPGLRSKSVNVEKSFQKMKNVGAFLENYLVFEQKSPQVSSANNMDKIIKKGNPLKLSVAIVLEANSDLEGYFEEMGMDYAILTTKETADSHIQGEKINVDYAHYTEVEKELSKANENHNICFVERNSKELCLKKKKILVEPTKEINNHNASQFLSKVEAGDILYLRNLDLSYLKLLIQNIVYKGYTILPLSMHISEER